MHANTVAAQQSLKQTLRSAGPLLIAPLLALCLWFLSASPVQAALIPVSATCTLAESITAANTDNAVAGCPAGSGPDTVVLTPTVYTLNLIDNFFDGNGSNGLPAITSTVTISGNGAVIERNLAYSCPGGANPTFRLIYVETPGDLTLHDVALRNGCTIFDGGGLYNTGTVAVQGSSIYSNTAYQGSGGGLYNNGGTATVQGSAVYSNTASGDGGGLYNDGAGAVMSITAQSTVYANTSGQHGGGLINDGTVTLQGSSIYSNTASQFGGGIYNFGAGAVVSMTAQSAIYANTASQGGGLYNQNGNVTAQGSAVYSNTASIVGGGLYNTGVSALMSITAQSTVYANTAYQGSGGGLYNVGALTVQGSDVYSNSAQRGGGLYNGESTIIVQGSSFYSNTASQFGGGIYNDGTVTVQGSAVYSNSAQYAGGLYNFGTLTVQGSDVYSNTASGDGGGLYNDGGTATIQGSSVYSNTAGSGGGLYNFGASALMSITAQSTVYSNTASLFGGGLFNTGKVTVQGSSVYSNTAGANGGGLYNDGTLTVQGSAIYANSAQLGGGLYNSPSAVISITAQSAVYANTASQNGGGLFNENGTVTMQSSAVYANSAQLGGGLYNSPSAVISITAQSAVYANRAIQGGGFVNNGTATVQDSDVYSNNADFGGGLYNAGTVTVQASSIYSNTANQGGGLVNSHTATVQGSAVYSNSAQFGGGLYNSGASAVMSITAQSAVYANTASQNGGGLFNEGTATVQSSALYSNTALAGGGLYNSETSITTVTSTEIRANSVISNGGGILNKGLLVATTAKLLTNNADLNGGALYQEAGQSILNGGCVVDNTNTAVHFASGAPIDASQTWWGAADGPSGVAPGSGDSVSSNVTTIPFLTSAPGGCPTHSSNPIQATLKWSAATYTTGEGDGDFTTHVKLSPIDPDTTITVQVTISGQNQQLISFPPGASDKPVVITVQNNTLVQDDISIQLALQNPIAAKLGSPSTATLTIHDDESPLGLVVVKSADRSEAQVGETIQYSYEITNTGNAPLTIIAVDDKLGAVSALATGGVLPVGDSRSTTLSHLVTAGDLAHEPLVNTVTVTGTANGGVKVKDTDSVSVHITAAEPNDLHLVVVKSADRSEAQVGETIHYSYEITNTGNAPLTIAAVDNKLGAVSALATGGALAAGDSRSATMSHIVTTDDLAHEPLVNTVTVTGTANGNVTTKDTDSVSVHITPAETPDNEKPEIALTLSADKPDAQVGDTISITYRITNTGVVTITAIALTDSGQATAAAVHDLPPNATTTGSIAYDIPFSDWPGPLEKSVEVTVTAGNGQSASKTATITIPLHQGQTRLPTLGKQ